MITLDTSALFALINGRDTNHERVKQVLIAEAGPYLIPAGILAEIAYLLEKRVPDALDAFLADLDSGAFSLECGAEDLPRIRELVRRYGDLPLGFADASVVACAERFGNRVLTLDARDFGIVAREGSLVVLPE